MSNLNKLEKYEKQYEENIDNEILYYTARFAIEGNDVVAENALTMKIKRGEIPITNIMNEHLTLEDAFCLGVHIGKEQGRKGNKDIINSYMTALGIISDLNKRIDALEKQLKERS